jgi:hypothetical protein
VQLLSFFILALVSTTLIFVSLPQFFWCPRWAVHVSAIHWLCYVHQQF